MFILVRPINRSSPNLLITFRTPTDHYIISARKGKALRQRYLRYGHAAQTKRAATPLAAKVNVIIV